MFPIYLNIQKWFQKEIDKNRIDVNFITEAKIILSVEKPVAPEKIRIEMTKWIFFKKIYEIDRYEFKTVISCILKTDEHDYSKKSMGGNLELIKKVIWIGSSLTATPSHTTTNVVGVSI